MKNQKEKVEEIRAKIVELVAKNYLTKDNRYNNEILAYTALIAWLKDEKLEEKSRSFIELSELLELQLLFKRVKDIDKNKDEKLIVDTINLYLVLIKSEKYKELTDICGYKLPNDFMTKKKYLDSSLKNKVDFFNVFKEKLLENLEIDMKRGEIKK